MTGLGVFSGVCGVFGVILYALGVSGPGGFLTVLGACLLVAAIIIGLYVADDCRRGSKAACPTCKRWWARERENTVVLETKKCYGLVTRCRVTSTSGYYSGSGYSSSGRYSGSQGGTVSGSSYSKWEERVPVIRTTYEHHFHCLFCGDCWPEEEVKEVEDFDIERP
jgi:hypothetical protein